MPLIKSISGIRGTIGSRQDDGLTPIDIVKYTSAYAKYISSQSDSKLIVIGRDARISGEMVAGLVRSTLASMGMDVLDLGLSTTPTVEMAVQMENSAGGIIITASHNPKEWNALKMLNHLGEFISAKAGAEILKLAELGGVSFAEINNIGTYRTDESYLNKHIRAILATENVITDQIRTKGLTIVVDAVNSSGGFAVPELLRALGVENIIEINCDPTGHFAHDPEPLPGNLIELSRTVVSHKADLGIAVDPDVDRLAIVCEDGSMFGEEYTLVAVADYLLSLSPGNTVSNLSSSRALKDITEAAGGQYYASAVGEVNVVAKMKEVNAIIGGEGNGGIIYPGLHYGRDALVGIALFLSYLAQMDMPVSSLRKRLPEYTISKNKINLIDGSNPEQTIEQIKNIYAGNNMIDTDGLRIDFENDWVHLRKSNTEPIIRVYAESTTAEKAQNLANQIIEKIKKLM